jgi:hypothetical protein
MVLYWNHYREKYYAATLLDYAGEDPVYVRLMAEQGFVFVKDE